ncbi:MAG: RNA polymerase sigma factor WhiG [Candidatus Lindowbacteria bacterium RIFCSPLOWO2_12_FULL_62_27]|nr:MAG: RNA polymerase sigma factor WhiG [Candidatus Lindowbacteria bacterium RIFCSPLOWO2_12_FULL_62_27]OGH63886.1 MAG: RNA polymerase sigma factor WhiG [Candidatus Lindowbacteria bacterium RIFCSPLOWO2_02_FULL_62_12]
MTEEEEMKLWKIYKKTSDLDARNKLILYFAPVVKFVAGRMMVNMPPNVEYEDLVSYGTLGLIDAIDKFDITKGIKFKTYANLRIQGAILDELRASDWIPRSIRKKARDVERAIQALEAKLGRPATDEEIAKALDMSFEEYAELLSQISGTAMLSLNDVWYIGKDDDEITVGDQVEDTESTTPDLQIERDEAKSLLKEMILKLPEREKQVIYLYYYEELTLKEIGEVLNVTESRVSQIHTQCILRLRSKLAKERELFGSL